MRRYGKWILVFVAVCLMGGGILWWRHRRAPRRIVLNNLPSLSPPAPRHRTDIDRHNGRPMEVAVSPN